MSETVIKVENLSFSHRVVGPEARRPMRMLAIILCLYALRDGIGAGGQTIPPAIAKR